MKKNNLRHRFSSILQFLLIAAVALLPCTLSIPAGASSSTAGVTSTAWLADDEQLELPIMHLTHEQRREHHNAFTNATKAKIDAIFQEKLLASNSYSSVDNLAQIPDYNQRNQGSAGNCWVWGCTAAMEGDYYNQFNGTERISIQYFDSNFNNGAAGNWAGCGGYISWFVNFYNSKKIAVPWSNTNAYYQDGSRGCSAGTAVAASSITTTPNHAITSVTSSTISTESVSQATAIANIKSVINQGKVPVFCFFLSDAGWSSFRSFWRNGPESTLWSDFSCGQNTTGGHAVACVGYNDDDPDTANHYWVMLNSWGTSTGHPSGLFRVKMYYDYTCGDDYGWTNTEWWTVNTVFTGGSTATVPAAPSLSSPAAGATVTGDSVTFAWNASSKATKYRLTVTKASDSSTFFSQELGNVTSYKVTGFPSDGTQYKWCVAAGNTAGWSANSAQRTFTSGQAVPVPGAPALSSPLNGATLYTTSITFRWGTTSGATAYRLTVINASDNSTFLSQELGKVTYYTATGFPNNGTQFRWCVAAGNSSGWSADSALRTFNSGKVITIPTVPTQYSPATNATVVGSNIVFRWSAPYGATKYRLTITKVSDDSTFFSQELGKVTYYTVSGFPNDGTQFKWCVAAGNSAGWSADSAQRNFNSGKVITIPAVPTQYSPANNATVVGSNIVFRWSAPYGATKYRLTITKVSDDSTFFSQELGKVTYYTVSGFPNDGTQFKWSVAAGNSAGWSADTAQRTFNSGRVITIPASPVLYSPANNFTATTSSITFRWSAPYGATSYRLIVTNAGDGSTFFSQELGRVTYYTVTGFPNDGTQFNWSVAAGNSAGWSADSAQRTFNSGH